MIGDAVQDGGHAVLANAKANIAAGRILSREILAGGDVVQRGTEKIGTAAEQQRHCFRQRLEQITARLACGDLCVGRKRRQIGDQTGRHGIVKASIQQRREGGIRRAPCLEERVPFLVAGSELLLVLRKIGAHVVGNVEVFVRQTQTLACGVGKFRAAFAVGLAGAGDFWNAFANEGFGDDELRLAAAGVPGLRHCVHECADVVAVHSLHFEAVSFVALRGVLALRGFCHRVEGDIIGVVNKDQVVQAEMSGECRRLGRDPFLQATVARETDDAVIKDGVSRGIELRRSHPGGEGHANGIAHALAERPARGLDAGCFAELRVTRRAAVELAEVLQLLQRQVIAGEMKPCVKEHAAVAGRKHETVAVDPPWLVGVVLESATVERRADFGAAERQTEVAGVAGVHGVNGQPACLCRSARKDVNGYSHGVETGMVGFGVVKSSRRTG